MDYGHAICRPETLLETDLLAGKSLTSSPGSIAAPSTVSQKWTLMETDDESVTLLLTSLLTSLLTPQRRHLERGPI